MTLLFAAKIPSDTRIGCGEVPLFKDGNGYGNFNGYSSYYGDGDADGDGDGVGCGCVGGHAEISGGGYSR